MKKNYAVRMVALSLPVLIILAGCSAEEAAMGDMAAPTVSSGATLPPSVPPQVVATSEPVVSVAPAATAVPSPSIAPAALSTPAANGSASPAVSPPKVTKEAAEAYIGQSLETLYSSMGQPQSSSYANSCLGDGDDGELYYEGFTVYTYREDGVEEIIAVE